MPNQDIQKQISDLQARIKTLEDNRFIFPIKLSELEKKSINNVLFACGSVTIPVSGIARATFPGLTPNMVVIATYSSGAPTVPISCGIQPSVLLPGLNEVQIAGDIGLDVDFAIFLTSNKNI